MVDPDVVGALPDVSAPYPPAAGVVDFLWVLWVFPLVPLMLDEPVAPMVGSLVEDEPPDAPMLELPDMPAPLLD